MFLIQDFVKFYSIGYNFINIFGSFQLLTAVYTDKPSRKKNSKTITELVFFLSKSQYIE